MTTARARFDAACVALATPGGFADWPLVATTLRVHPEWGPHLAHVLVAAPEVAESDREAYRHLTDGLVDHIEDVPPLQEVARVIVRSAQSALVREAGVFALVWSDDPWSDQERREMRELFDRETSGAVRNAIVEGADIITPADECIAWMTGVLATDPDPDVRAAACIVLERVAEESGLSIDVALSAALETLEQINQGHIARGGLTEVLSLLQSIGTPEALAALDREADRHFWPQGTVDEARQARLSGLAPGAEGRIWSDAVFRSLLHASEAQPAYWGTGGWWGRYAERALWWLSVNGANGDWVGSAAACLAEWRDDADLRGARAGTAVFLQHLRTSGRTAESVNLEVSAAAARFAPAYGLSRAYEPMMLTALLSGQGAVADRAVPFLSPSGLRILLEGAVLGDPGMGGVSPDEIPGILSAMALRADIGTLLTPDLLGRLLQVEDPRVRSAALSLAHTITP